MNLCSVSDPRRVPNKESGLDDLEQYRNTCPYRRQAEVFDYQGMCFHSAPREDIRLLDGR